MRKDSNSSPHNRKKGRREGGEGRGGDVREKQKVSAEKNRVPGVVVVVDSGEKNGIKEGGKSQVGLGRGAGVAGRAGKSDEGAGGAAGRQPLGSGV